MAPPAVVSATVAAAIWPKPVKATTSAVAAVGICGRSRYRCAKSGYPGHAQNLCSDVAEGVGENDRHHRQAAHQECSYALAKDYCHGLHPSTREKSVNYPSFANERVSMPAVPSEPVFDLSLSVIAPAELGAQIGQSHSATCRVLSALLQRDRLQSIEDGMGLGARMPGLPASVVPPSNGKVFARPEFLQIHIHRVVSAYSFLCPHGSLPRDAHEDRGRQTCSE